MAAPKTAETRMAQGFWRSGDGTIEKSDSAGFTLDTYTHVTTQMQEDAAQRIGRFMAASEK